MHMVYNGIELEVLELEQYVEEMVYDDTGVDKLYDRISIQGQFLVNGQVEVDRVVPVTSYDFDANSFETLRDLWLRTAPDAYSDANALEPGAADINYALFGKVRSEFGPYTYLAGDGVYAVAPDNLNTTVVFKSVVPCVNTDRIIRERLSQPRGHLFLFTGRGDPGRRDELLLASPAFNAHTDCKNGPIPKMRSITSFHGDAQTFVVSFGIETYINTHKVCFDRGLLSAGADDVLLSNRFSMRHVVDQDSYLVRETQGTAIFRTDLIYSTPLRVARAGGDNPTQYAPNLMLPVPFGMVREQIEIETLPDVTGCRYRFRDRQCLSNFTAGPYANATEIEAIHRQAIVTDEDALSGAIRGYERALNLRTLRRQSEERLATAPLPAKPTPLLPKIPPKTP